MFLFQLFLANGRIPVTTKIRVQLVLPVFKLPIIPYNYIHADRLEEWDQVHGSNYERMLKVVLLWVIREKPMCSSQLRAHNIIIF